MSDSFKPVDAPPLAFPDPRMLRALRVYALWKQADIIEIARSTFPRQALIKRIYRDISALRPFNDE